jgi:D-alanyl-D-alanine dipeptidase
LILSVLQSQLLILPTAAMKGSATTRGTVTLQLRRVRPSVAPKLKGAQGENFTAPLPATRRIRCKLKPIAQSELRKS